MIVLTFCVSLKWNDTRYTFNINFSTLGTQELPSADMVGILYGARPTVGPLHPGADGGRLSLPPTSFAPGIRPKMI